MKFNQQNELNEIDRLSRYDLEGVFDSHLRPEIIEDPSQIAQDLRRCKELTDYAKNH